MKKFFALLCAILLILTMLACAQSNAPAQSPKPTATATSSPTASTPTPASASPAATFTLRYATDFPELSSTYLEIQKPVLDEIEKRSNGRITITKFTGGVLGKGTENYDMAKTGKCDFTLHATGYTPGRFPMADVLTFPGAFETTNAGEEAAQAIFDKVLYKEYTDTQPLAMQQTQTYYIYMVNKPVKVLEDLKGLKIRTAGGFVTDALKALGATPVPLALSDMYTSLQTGVVDGAVIGPSGLPAQKLQEVLRHITKVKFGCSTQVWVMNSDTWAKLPSDLKAIVKDAPKLAGPGQVKLFAKEEPAVEKQLLDKGGTAYVLPAAEEKRWAEAMKPIAEKWVADMKAKGLPADELMNIVREETKKRNVPFPY